MYSLTYLGKIGFRVERLFILYIYLREFVMSWASILGSDLNLEFMEIALALTGSVLTCLTAMLLFVAYHHIDDDTRG